MKFAFCLFKYFPFGGLQRDFLRIAEECQRRGHVIHVYTMAWEGDVPPGMNVHIIPVKHLANHQRCLSFVKKLQQELKKEQYDLVVGFNKMPGLDVYYAADPCYVAKMQTQRSNWYQFTPRYRAYAQLEDAVFGISSHTQILLIAEREQAVFQQYYATPVKRFHILPPGIAHDRRSSVNAVQIRKTFRLSLQIPLNNHLALMVGSGFKTKGVDRAILAIHALPDEVRQNTQLLIIGQDNPHTYLNLAKRLGVAEQVKFLGGRSDVPRFLAAADVLLHPAYYENTGTVLLEALVAGLPVLTTDVCGYANHIERAGAGVVLNSPFLQAELNQQLLWMLTSERSSEWRTHALLYAANTDLYSMPERATEIIEQTYKEKNNKNGTNVYQATEFTESQSTELSFKKKSVKSAEIFEQPLLKPAALAYEGETLVEEKLEQNIPRKTAIVNVAPITHNESVQLTSSNLIIDSAERFEKNANKLWFRNCLELTHELQKHWRSTDVFTKIFRQSGDVFREQKGRKTLRFEVGDKSYFAKLHQGVGWLEIIKNLLHARLPVLGAQQEWRAILRLNALGVPTAKLAGFGSKGWNPARLKSFVIMEELRNTISLEDFCKEWIIHKPDHRLKRALIAEVARIARVLHTHGINHRDFYLCHFLLDITNGEQAISPKHIRLYLLDLHRMQQRRHMPIRWQIKDLAGLYFSSLEIGLTKRDYLRFLTAYYAKPLAEILPAEKKLWQAVRTRALNLYGKEKLKYLVNTANLTIPLNFALNDSNQLLMSEQILRVVPNKRWVLLAQWPGHQVVAKIFINWRNAQQELKGYAALEAAGIATPKLVYHGWIAGETLYVLLFSYIYPAKDYALLWNNSTDIAREGYLRTLIQVIAQLHKAGLQQKDLHLKNFLLNDEKTWVLDPASIQKEYSGLSLSEPKSLDNTALLLAQVPTRYDYLAEKLYAAYTKTRDIVFTLAGLDQLQHEVAKWRRYRLRKYSKKVMRSNTLSLCRQDWWRFTLYDRNYDTKAMQLLLKDPDTILNSPITKILKAGNTCTVGLVSMEGKLIVIKRYNIKGFWHGLKRAVTPTRAARSWRNAHRLSLLEIPTAKPIALMERRCGPLRHTAYYISEYITGTRLTDYFTENTTAHQAQEMASNIKQLLRNLAEVRISHGDLKASNILLVNNKPYLLDLDAMRLHRFNWIWHRVAKRDYDRLLKNWADNPQILKYFQD